MTSPRGDAPGGVADAWSFAGVRTEPRPLQLAGLSESVPKLFLSLVNDAIKGEIKPTRIRYEAPSSVVLENVAVLDDNKQPVAQVARARATLSLSSLLAGEIVVSKVVLEAPELSLVLENGSLNLLRAFTPKKPAAASSSDSSSTAFRIDAIEVSDGRFGFTDRTRTRVTASGIAARAALTVDLAHEYVLVDVNDVVVAQGAVDLEQLGVPITDVHADRVRFLRDKVEIQQLRGKALGARVTGGGTVGVEGEGSLNLKAHVDAPANAWPARLDRLAFDTPAAAGDVSVQGPFAAPLVKVVADLGAAELYGYALDGAHAVVDISTDAVRIRPGSVVSAGSGTLRIEGAIALATLTLDLKGRANDLALATLLRPAQLDPAPRGVVSGTASLAGTVDDAFNAGRSSLQVEADLIGRRLQLVGVKLAEANVALRGSVNATRVQLARADVTGSGVQARVTGEVRLKEEALALEVSAGVARPGQLVVDLPKEITGEDLQFTGTVRGPYKAVRVEGSGTLARGNAYGTPVDAVSTQLVVTTADVSLRELRATVAGGTARADGAVTVGLRGARALAGRITLTDADLSTVVAPDGSALPIAGRATATVVLTGTIAQPLVTAPVRITSAVVAEEPLGEVRGDLRATKTRLTVDNLRVVGPTVRARTDRFALNISDYTGTAVVDVEQLVLGEVVSLKSVGLVGTARGRAVLTGDVRSPTVSFVADATGLALKGVGLGDGRVVAGIKPEGVAADGAGSRRHTATVALHVRSTLGEVQGELAYAIERKMLNANLRFSEIDLETASAKTAGLPLLPMGFASGRITAQGALDALTGSLELRVPELAVRRPAAADVPNAAAQPARVLGPVQLNATLVNGAVDARVCAFPGPAAAPAAAPSGAAPCTAGERVWATAQGPVGLTTQTYDLRIRAHIDEPKVTDYVAALAENGIEVGAALDTDVHLVRVGDNAPTAVGTLSLSAARVGAPSTPVVELVEPVQATFTTDGLRLSNVAHLRSARGDVDLSIGGSIGRSDINLDVHGALSLVLLKLVSPQVANASGLVDTEATIRGRYDAGLEISGEVTPRVDSSILLRAIGQPLTFKSGSLAVHPRSAGVLTVEAHDLKAALGDGAVGVRGAVDLRTKRALDEAWFTAFDLRAAGNVVGVKVSDARVDGAFDLALAGSDDRPTLTGKVEVTEGTYKKGFEFRNFFIAPVAARRSEPLYEMLAPYGLGNLQLALDVSLQNVRTRANVSTFLADISVRGELKLTDSLKFPSIVGAIEAEDGTIEFPRARFDVTEMQVEFPAAADGAINPVIHLSARTDLSPEDTGAATEIPVDLTLNGDFQNGMNLDLVASGAPREISRSELLGAILYAKSIQGVSDTDSQVAVRILMREATSTISREAATFIVENITGGELSLDAAGGFRWQLGRRLQLEGDGLFIPSTSTTDATTSTNGGAASTSGTDGLRGRLLLVDHLPPIRSISLDGRTGSGNAELRLSFRIFEN